MKRILPVVSIALVIAAAALAAEGGHAQEAGDPELGWKIANFILMAGVLGYLIKKKAGGFFAGRSAEIRAGLEEAAKLKEDAEARYAEMEQRLANLGAEVENLRAQARQESAAEGERVRGEIQRETQKIQAQAEQEIASVSKAARQELREYSARLAIDLASKRIRERLTPEKDRTLVDAMLKDLEHRPGAGNARVS